jgi:hypothetical protein
MCTGVSYCRVTLTFPEHATVVALTFISMLVFISVLEGISELYAIRIRICETPRNPTIVCEPCALLAPSMLPMDVCCPTREPML